ncbi:MAG: SH3 domain-containing protein [Pseudomonadota bacterium]
MPGFVRVQFFMVCFTLAFYGCSKTQPEEPVSGGDLSRIDPDQKAIPKDEPVLPKDTDGPAPEPQAKSESSSESNPDAKPVRDATLDVRSGQVVPESPLPEATTDASAPAKVGSGPQKKFIEAATLNIRSQPNRFSKIVGSLKGGDEVHVKIHGGWAKLDEGQWIRSRWLVKSRPSSFSNATDEDSAKPVKRSKAHNTKKNKSKKRNNFKQTSGNQ